MRKPTQALIDWLVKDFNASENGDDSYYQNRAKEAIVQSKLSVDEFNRLMGVEPDGPSRLKSMVSDAVREALSDRNSKSTITVDDLFGNDSGRIRLKNASERYDNTKSTAIHAKTGKPVLNEHRQQVQLPSELEYAKAGAFFKYLARRQGENILLSEHEKALVEECFEKDAWCGEHDSAWVTNFDGMKVKALLNDGTSGGSSLVPEFFDVDLVSFPLLHSEIFPLVDLRPVPRGNTVEGGSVGNPTVEWGVGEGTPASLFDTDDLVAAISSTIHPVTAAIEVGRDFLSDSPAEVGRVLMGNVNQRMANELDRVVVGGDGTSEPEGIATASGVTAINSENDTTGPPTYEDYLALYFGIGKQYRNAASRPAFISNDTTYQRSRNIKVDTATPSTDQRPVLNTVNEVGNYMSLGLPHKIENNLGNSTAIFGALSRYRMYRRQGAEIRWESGGKELARRNVNLLIVRARYGGKVIDSNAFAKSTDFQS